MSLDLKFAAIYYALSVALLVVIVLAAFIRLIINHAFAVSGHKFYLAATGKDPECATCPFNKRCPYSNGVTCKFIRREEVKDAKENCRFPFGAR